ncbi:hypothetical protein [Roseateles amylovorans]|uniref:Uncharacterized protein n=1 Tax=Roseateles amylovorans TaxID=2978473 RepID=A0ABY6B949_9BURK|nr:hypothetical protein [Roseateles amylovorans]UXH80105.1 hypothetical protein N4261_09570 [Roseateles amylovorans]
MSKKCSGSFSMLFGGARWNAEVAEQEAVHVVQKACWPVNMAEGLDHEANPLYQGWAEMQRWGLSEDLLLTLRVKSHPRLDQPELWIDVKAMPV